MNIILYWIKTYLENVHILDSVARGWLKMYLDTDKKNC